MIINHNLGAMNANRNMGINQSNAGKSMEKLSSGLRINRAGDDAAGLAISEKMRGQIRGLDQASANAQDGISMIQTAEGALNETHSILQRMRELSVQSANDTNVSVDRGEIQKEMDELAKEVTRIANNTEFNTQKLINGGIADTGISSAKFHVGANANQDITLSINAMDAKSLGVSRDKVTGATGTVAGTNIAAAGATFSGGSYGAGVINGATVTAVYAAGAVTPATAGALNGTATVGTAIAGDAGDFKFSVDGGAIKTATIATGDDLAAVIGKINAQVAGTASNVGGKLVLTSGSTGAGSNVTVLNTSNAATLSFLGFTGGQTNTGAASTTAPNTLTLTSDKGQTQTVSISAAATSLNVTTGNFQGMNLTFATTASAVTGGADKVAISATAVAAAKAVFVGGALTNAATTEAGIDVSTQSNASNAISTIQSSIETVSAERSKLGAYQNRLEHTIANLGTSSENLTSAESRIRDVNMAKEMSTFSKNNILSQAAQAMLAQANQQPQQVLQLLR